MFCIDRKIIQIFISFQLRDSTLFPDGSSVEFRCDENHFTGHDFALEGNSTLTCHDGSWDRRIPFCRRTASDRGAYSGKYQSKFEIREPPYGHARWFFGPEPGIKQT